MIIGIGLSIYKSQIRNRLPMHTSIVNIRMYKLSKGIYLILFYLAMRLVSFFLSIILGLNFLLLFFKVLNDFLIVLLCKLSNFVLP